MAQIRIAKWYDPDTVCWEGEATGLRAALRQALASRAVLTGAVLTGADLTDADLTGADLTRADLTRADLTRADLTDAVLTGADLTRADLTGAVLTGAVLTGAVLTRADLTRADLTDAVLTDAVLTGADLTRADLTGAVLTPIRDDLWAMLSAAPAEAPALLVAVREGRINGSCYYGECACLVGTIANARHCDVDKLGTLRPNSARPAERFFLGISEGDTPENSQPAALVAQWIDEWLTAMRAAFAPVGQS